MTLPGSENRTTHVLNHLAIQVTVDCFTPHEVIYLFVGRMVCHKGHVSSFLNKCNKTHNFFLITIFWSSWLFLNCPFRRFAYSNTKELLHTNSPHKKNHNATWVRIASFWKETVLCIQLVRQELFELSWFHLNCNPKYTKTILVLISKACTEWCWSTHMFEEQNWYALQSGKLQVTAEFTETCSLAACCAAILSFQTGMDATLLNYMCLGVCGMLQSFQWCSNVGCNSHCFSSVGQFQISFSSGVPVYHGSIPLVVQWYPSVHWVNQWHSNVHWTSQCTLAQGKGTQKICIIFNKPHHTGFKMASVCIWHNIKCVPHTLRYLLTLKGPCKQFV